MMRPLLHALFLILLAAACALAVMPARWLIAALPASGLLTAADATGSIWSGSATLAVGRPELRRTLPEPLRWALRLDGGLYLAVRHPALGGELRVSPTWRGLRVSAQSLRLPASALPTFHAALGALYPEGELALSWPTLTIGPGTRSQGAQLLELRWNNASSSLTRIRPMGTYRISLTQGEAGGINLALSTLTGPLQLQGQGSVALGRGLQFDGTARADATATPDVQAALGGLLGVLGARSGDHYQLRFR